MKPADHPVGDHAPIVRRAVAISLCMPITALIDRCPVGARQSRGGRCRAAHPTPVEPRAALPADARSRIRRAQAYAGAGDQASTCRPARPRVRSIARRNRLNRSQPVSVFVAAPQQRAGRVPPPKDSPAAPSAARFASARDPAHLALHRRASSPTDTRCRRVSSPVVVSLQISGQVVPAAVQQVRHPPSMAAPGTQPLRPAAFPIDPASDVRFAPFRSRSAGRVIQRCRSSSARPCAGFRGGIP